MIITGLIIEQHDYYWTGLIIDMKSCVSYRFALLTQTNTRSENQAGGR